MKYSTANWIAILFIVIGAVPVSIYFYLDAKDSMVPFLTAIVKPVAVIAFFTAVFFLLANIMASRRQEERIKKSHFQSAFVLLLCLAAFRVLLHLI